MKRALGITLVIAIIYLLFQGVINQVFPNYRTDYVIDTGSSKYSIEEKYVSNFVDENTGYENYDSYNFKITFSDEVFEFKLLKDSVGKNVIKDIVYYENKDLSCIYPVLKDETSTFDIICKKDSVYYNSLTASKIADIDPFIKQLKELGYEHNNWNTESSIISKINSFSFYSENWTKDLVVILWNYRGLTIINSEQAKEIRVLSSDVYKNTNGQLFDKYYVFPNYTEDKTYYKTLFRIDVARFFKNEIRLNNNIAYDSYYQGFLNDKLYIYDRYNMNQIELNLKTMVDRVIGNRDIPGRFYTNKWIETNVVDFNNQTFGVKEDVPGVYSSNAKYYKVDEFLGSTDGYYYLYEKIGSEHIVWRIDKANPQALTKLFTAGEIANVKYVDDYIFFINGDTIYSYNDNQGLVPLVKSNELKFNRENIYDIYLK